jgi:hypothetical protein
VAEDNLRRLNFQTFLVPEVNMSAERMMVNAMQEQPILLLPILVLVFFMMRALASAARALSANFASSELRF